MLKRLAFTGFAVAALMSAAHADSMPAPVDAARFAEPSSVVLAVRAEKAVEGGAVRLAVYDGEETFLESALSKYEARLDDNGLALVSLGEIAPGDYAFVAYYDENGDGKLNRSAIGKPKEPIAFSNGVKPKLRKPRFNEAKVDVAPGAVVVLTLDD